MLTMMPEEGTTCNEASCSKKVAPRQFSLRMGADGSPIYFCSSECASRRIHQEPTGHDFIADWAIGQALAV